MPSIEYFPYGGPNRRSDKPVIEILLKFGPNDINGLPREVADIKDLLVNAGILTPDEVFPQQPLPDERMAWYASLLVQTALLFQRKTGHRVNYFAVSPMPQENRCLALLEHEHGDVGMTAVKLACELFTGRRKLLAEPFQMFSKFASDRLLPIETEAILRVAARRDIQAVHLERNPFKRVAFSALTGDRCIRPNGLLMLGYGEQQHVLDGTYCIDSAEDFSGLFDVGRQQAATQAVPGPEVAGLESSAELLLNRLFPSKIPVRMPIIAITGTNGKTTTTRMVSQIISTAGYKPGVVCTDGVFLNGQLLDEGDFGARVGHLKVLTSKKVDFAVLETHHKGIVHDGFAFPWCDVAVCLNVTEDHLGQSGIDTVEQMAEIKSALPERGRQAVVLNADDPHCLAMLDRVTAKNKCLVSLESSGDQLFETYGNTITCCCVLEVINKQQFMVFYDKEQRLPVMPVDSIPATFGGTALFMVSNAMHAVAACYLSGVRVETIQTAMSSFASSYESTPGRLNVFNELPFQIFMDFAHNPDGMRRICEFIDRQKVTGRKLVAFAGSIDRTDETIKRMAKSMAGHFDFYFCKEYLRADESRSRPVAHILQQGLIEAGVAKNQTALTTKGQDAIFKIFDACKPGDLLLMLVGHVEKHLMSGYIRNYAGILSEQKES